MGLSPEISGGARETLTVCVCRYLRYFGKLHWGRSSSGSTTILGWCVVIRPGGSNRPHRRVGEPGSPSGLHTCGRLLALPLGRPHFFVVIVVSCLCCNRPHSWKDLAMKIACSWSLRSLALAGLAAMYCVPSFAQSAPFAGLAGAWTGSGTISLSDGSRERLRCRASYRVNDHESGLQQTLRCAGDSYRFELSTDVVSQGGRISGTWSESSRNIAGSIEGRVSGGHIVAAVGAPGFSASLSLTTQGNRQSISIASQGDIRNVSISMVRS